MEEVGNIYLQQDEPLQSCWLALRSIIKKHDSEITETVKYGAPCFLYKGTIICYLWKDKKTLAPYLLLQDGKFFQHPSIEAGDRKRMKIMPINPEEDIPVDEVKEVLNLAIAYKNEKLKK